MNINLKIDVSKLDKERLKKNSFTKRDGTQVHEVNADLVLIEKKEPRIIKEGDSWTLKETHFIAEKRDKDEESNYVGIGTQFFDKEIKMNDNVPQQDTSVPDYPVDELTADMIPF